MASCDLPCPSSHQVAKVAQIRHAPPAPARPPALRALHQLGIVCVAWKGAPPLALLRSVVWRLRRRGAARELLC